MPSPFEHAVRLGREGQALGNAGQRYLYALVQPPDSPACGLSTPMPISANSRMPSTIR